MLDDDKKDLGPFDEEYFDDDFDDEDDHIDDIPPPPPSDDDSDLKADDTPAVSVTKKKNIVLLVIVSLVVVYFASQILSDKKSRKKIKPKNEAEEMSDKFREKSKVPELKSNIIPISAIKRKEIKNSAEDLIVAPPPPPLIEPSSRFTSAANNTPSGLPNLNPKSFSALSGGSSEDNLSKRTLALARSNSSGGGRSALPNLGGGAGNTGAVVSEDYASRIKAPMFLMQSPDTKYVRDKVTKSIEGINYPDRNFALAMSGSSKSSATFVGNLKSVILQGKVIDAVLETAINTDLPDGILRGIVSRDVYSEKGRRILIPKGSRLIGGYSTEVKFGQARVFIIWNRVIRPDGIDAVIDSNSTDMLGRNGVYGKLDNRFFEIFGSSILLSSISVAFAVAASEFADSPESTNTIGSGGVAVENVNPENEAIKSSVTEVGSKISEIAEELIETKPQILVDQGSTIKIFVNKDIHFPDSFASENTVDIIH